MDWLTSWQAFALCSAFLAGLTALLGKVGVADINSNLATLIRTVVILVSTVLTVSCFNQWQRPQEILPKTWIFLVLSGVTTALSWLCYYRALQLGPVSKVASLDKLSVVVAILLGILILGEKFTWQAFLGGALIVIGAILMAIFN